MRRAFRKVAASYVPLAAVLIGLVATVDPRRNDFFQFWYAGHLVFGGLSPYDQSSWTAASSYGELAHGVVVNCPRPDAAACLWLYPPWTAWLLTPIGALTPELGILAVEALSIVSLGVGLALAFLLVARDRRTMSVTLAAVALSAPVIRDAFTGPVEGLLLVGVMSVAYALRRGRIALLAIGIFLLSLNLRSIPVVVAAVGVYAGGARSWRAIFAAIGTVTALIVVGAALEARWIPATLHGAAAKVALGENGSLLAARDVPAAIQIVSVLAAAAISVVLLHSAIQHRDPAVAVATGTALALATSPYLQSYDNVLLIPALAIAVRDGRWRLLTVGGWVVASWVVYVLELRGEIGYAGLLPVATLLILGVAVLLPSREGGTLSGRRALQA